MGRRRKYDASGGEPLLWRVTEWKGGLRVVELDMVPPLMPGETLVWEGAARHLVEAYQNARNSGLPVYLTKDGFKLRRRRAGRGTDTQSG